MKLKLNKKKLKNLSKDFKAVPKEMTPQVGGGTLQPTDSHMTFFGGRENCGIWAWTEQCN
ncbi:hypothetical protein [Pseudoalteromonas denitrificans]|jgi:hypothetical protein|uniref:Uncharacterized protein n=1 Tax=Pseudoalteromonas denitrificans DSM 6059 TaxID=1123010 RepID=A0A1I1TUQ8_9GAMM|nr:hypothetical protein [Pseudoalteromonas denitrificans]SFD60173.1 hypothetical protein SAMN02745724_04944 [Pseudoalteromonas denitrificans DSM 6059]